MTEQSQSMSSWTVPEKAFGLAALVSAVLAVSFGTVSGRWGAFAAAAFALGFAWWAARRARIKGDY
jgi:hypothetical protein